MPAKKEILYNKKIYQRNIDLGIDPECYECTSHFKYNTGYIKANRDGFSLMHRWIYWRKTGKKPEVVMHKCDNRICINPSHLSGGTTMDNISDKMKKNRHNFGRHPKLTENQVLEIKNMLKDKKMLQKDIAKLYNIDKSNISRINTGELWNNI